MASSTTSQFHHRLGSDDRDGTVKNHECPIWECGPNCGCPPECMNRVIQRGRSKDTVVELFKTRQKGWGEC